MDVDEDDSEDEEDDSEEEEDTPKKVIYICLHSTEFIFLTIAFNCA